MWIANFSMEQIQKGLHFDASWQPIVLIQIKDPDFKNFVSSPQQHLFKDILQLSFFDDEDDKIDSISDIQAKQIADFLLNAKQNEFNVMVHCHAGICRSGAVVEAGTLLGMTVPDGVNRRIPNLRVFNKVRKELGFFSSWEN